MEHGTRGGDELNIARKGKDYGWPTIAYGIEYNGQPILEGITAKEGMEQPIYYWDPVIAPSGMMFYTGSAFPAWRGNLFVGGMTQDLNSRAWRFSRVMRSLVRRLLTRSRRASAFGTSQAGRQHLHGDGQPQGSRAAVAAREEIGLKPGRG